MIAISTAYKEALIAIELDGKQVYKSLDSNCKHSENILYNIDLMIDQLESSIQENDYYAVVIGPGSFTGLRIGVALTKGLLAGDHEKKVIPITTFDLMAYSYITNFAPKEDFACIINGLSGYYFVCEYSKMGEKLGQERIITAHQLADFSRTVGLQEENLGEFKVSPTPQELLSLAKKKVCAQNIISAIELAPIYLRKSQAEDASEKNTSKK